MMVKRIAARPVDQPDIGIMTVTAVELIRRARIKQHVSQPRDGDRLFHRILPHRQTRAGEGTAVRSRQIGRGVGEPQPATGSADLPQQSRQRHRRPERLFTLPCALQ